MEYSKYNRDKQLNIKMGQHSDNETLLEESAALIREESRDIEVNMLRESISKYNREDMAASNAVVRKQKYLNESNWFALKSYITKLAVDQAKSLYDFKAIKEEYDVDPEQEIEMEVEETLMTEIPLSIQGEMGTVIPIKIEVTPETADVLQTVLKLMDQNLGAEKTQMDTGQIEVAADEAMGLVPEDTEAMVAANDKIADETVGIIAKDQQILAGIKAKMDELDLRVTGTEQILGQAGQTEFADGAPLGQEEVELIQDEETGLLVNPETGEIHDPETGEVIQEELHREHKIQTILEALAFRKGTKLLNEGANKYNRNAAIVGGINSLIIMEAFDHVFGRPTSYAIIKNRLKIK